MAPARGERLAPALCNRIDRNTGGIVIAAKNAETLRIINQKIRDREIDKRYLCITVGTPRPPQGEVSCFLLKDEKKKQVAVYHRPVPGGKTAVTRYRTLETRGELSLLEVELLTGRTHQIRATMADLGCPCWGTASTATVGEPPLRRDPAGPVFLPPDLRLPHGRRPAELPPGPQLSGG